MEKLKPTVTRRKALARLGLLATAACSAPLIARLDSARAAFPRGCGGDPGAGQGGGGTGNNPNNNPNPNAFKKKQNSGAQAYAPDSVQ